jgi:hypothetical protein
VALSSTVLPETETPGAEQTDAVRSEGGDPKMRYGFPMENYETEIKVISAWSMFTDDGYRWPI